jgi:hypothetical protein
MRIAHAVRRRFGITAPRVWVRAHIPWYWRWPLLLLMLVAGLGLAWLMYESGLRFAGFEKGEAEREVSQLADEVKLLRQENAQLRAVSLNNERQLSMERATQTDLANSLKLLQEENGRLKQDLLLIQNLKSRQQQADPRK